jgi:hypothetical protein
MGESGGDDACMLVLKVPGVVVPDLCFQGWRETAESAFLFVLFRHVDVGREYGRCFCGWRASNTSATKSWEFDSSCEIVAWEYCETLSTESLEAEIAPLEWRRTRSMSSGSRGSHENERWYDGGRETLFSCSTSDAMISAMRSLSLDDECTGASGVCEGLVRSCIVPV